MKEEILKSYIEMHICNHSRDDRENCAKLGAKVLTDEIKSWAKETHGKEIRIFRSGCLGKCSEGIAAVCYPDHKLFTEVQTSDAKELKIYLENRLDEIKN